MEETKEKQERTLKLLLEWEDDTIDVLQIKSVHKEEKHDAEAAEGLVFNIRIEVYSIPYQYTYSYKTPEFRDQRMDELKKKLEGVKVKFI